MIRRQLLTACLAAVLATTSSAGTPFWGAKQAAPYDTAPSQLKNGEFTWAPEVSPNGPITVLVSLDEQRAYAYRNGIQIGVATVSTGKKGHETPTGVFVTTFKDADHHSSKYNNAAMPFTQRFTNDGIALHAGGIPGYPESHGCVHLPSEFARLLFGVSPVGMTVVVSDHGHSPKEEVHPPMLAPITSKGAIAENRRLFPGESYRWEPEKSPQGVVSILVSGADQRAVVLRNGIEIGRSRALIREPERPLGTRVLVAKEGGESGKNIGHRWHSVDILGHMDDLKTAPTADITQRITLPAEFTAALAPMVAAGTTLMITDAPILEQTTGRKLSVLSSHPQ
jgi:hypothetical protein